MRRRINIWFFFCFQKTGERYEEETGASRRVACVGCEGTKECTKEWTSEWTKEWTKERTKRPNGRPYRETCNLPQRSDVDRLRRRPALRFHQSFLRLLSLLKGGNAPATVKPIGSRVVRLAAIVHDGVCVVSNRVADGDLLLPVVVGQVRQVFVLQEVVEVVHDAGDEAAHER